MRDFHSFYDAERKGIVFSHFGLTGQIRSGVCLIRN